MRRIMVLVAITGAMLLSLGGAALAANFVGTQQDDTIFGTNRADRIDGLNGNDDLFGSRGNDKIQGGDKDDQVVGGRDSDTLFGGEGEDVVFGGSTPDFLSTVDGKEDMLIDCGGGVDKALIDAQDAANVDNCENIEVAQ